MRNAIKVGAGIAGVGLVMELAYKGAMELIVHRADAVMKSWRSNRKLGE